MKKQFALIVLLMVGSLLSASVSAMSQSMGTGNGGQSMSMGNDGQSMSMDDDDDVPPPVRAPRMMQSSSGSQSMLMERKALQEKARLTRERNQELRQESQGARQEFRTENSGAIREMKQSGTGADREAIKKIQDERRNYISSLSGISLEQKSLYLSGIEDMIRNEIETRYANATGALQASRMLVYTENALRRAEALANQIDLRASRGALRLSEVDAMIAKITAELPNLTTEKKTKLAKKIDEKIVKIQSNKKLPETSKTEIIKKLTTLRNTLLK